MATTYNLQPTTYSGTFILIGRSGCGKGTQAELLKKYVEEKDAEKHPVLYIETGDRFRAFLSGNGYGSRLAREISEKGELQPEFLAVCMWGEELLSKVTGNEHLIMDGSPRRLREAMALDTALSFFKRQSPTVIHVDVSNEWSRERLKGRGRKDDLSEEEVNRRLSWFDSEVKPAIDWFRKEPAYKVVDINGEQTIEEVHRDIISAIFNFQTPNFQ